MAPKLPSVVQQCHLEGPTAVFKPSIPPNGRERLVLKDSTRTVLTTSVVVEREGVGIATAEKTGTRDITSKLRFGSAACASEEKLIEAALRSIYTIFQACTWSEEADGIIIATAGLKEQQFDVLNRILKDQMHIFQNTEFSMKYAEACGATFFGSREIITHISHVLRTSKLVGVNVRYIRMANDACGDIMLEAQKILLGGLTPPTPPLSQMGGNARKSIPGTSIIRGPLNLNHHARTESMRFKTSALCKQTQDPRLPVIPEAPATISLATPTILAISATSGTPEIPIGGKHEDISPKSTAAGTPLVILEKQERIKRKRAAVHKLIEELDAPEPPRPRIRFGEDREFYTMTAESEKTGTGAAFNPNVTATEKIIWHHCGPTVKNASSNIAVRDFAAEAKKQFDSLKAHAEAKKEETARIEKAKKEGNFGELKWIQENPVDNEGYTDDGGSFVLEDELKEVVTGNIHGSRSNGSLSVDLNEINEEEFEAFCNNGGLDDDDDDEDLDDLDFDDKEFDDEDLDEED
jgi:hypothetical protein